MRNLSPVMEKTLLAIRNHPEFWVSAYQLSCHTKTLDALADRKLLRRRVGPSRDFIASTLFNPMIDVTYCLTELGRTISFPGKAV